MARAAARKPILRENKRTDRLEPSDWIQCAQELLTERGIDGVRVEVLAKRLDVTKGSFYWHFKDREGLLNEMLQSWRKRATLGIIERLESTHESADRRLHRLLRLQFDARKAEIGAEIELSLRLWARHDPKAALALQEIDELRLRYIGKLLEELGIAKEETRARAMLIYCYMRVSRTLADPIRDKAEIEACERILTGTVK